MCSDSGSQGSVFLVDTLGDSGKLVFFFFSEKRCFISSTFTSEKGTFPCFLLRKVTCGLLCVPFS